MREGTPVFVSHGRAFVGEKDCQRRSRHESRNRLMVAEGC
jgi:hypothetical protein